MGSVCLGIVGWFVGKICGSCCICCLWRIEGVEEWICLFKRESKKKILVFNIDSCYYELCVLCFVLWCFRDFIVVSCVVFGLYGFGVLFELIILDCLL